MPQYFIGYRARQHGAASTTAGGACRRIGGGGRRHVAAGGVGDHQGRTAQAGDWNEWADGRSHPLRRRRPTPNRVRSVAIERAKKANRYQGHAPIFHGLVGSESCLAYGSF